MRRCGCHSRHLQGSSRRNPVHAGDSLLQPKPQQHNAAAHQHPHRHRGVDAVHRHSHSFQLHPGPVQYGQSAILSGAGSVLRPVFAVFYALYALPGRQVREAAQSLDQVAALLNRSGALHIAVPAAFRRGLQFPRQSPGRQALEFRRRIATGLPAAQAVGRASLRASGAAG